MASPMRPSPLSFNNAGRQSPFKRQNSVSPATTARATAPTQSPTKPTSSLSPTKQGSLSPEKISPFVRRPSQISHGSPERSVSPFARPPSQLGVSSTPPRPTVDSASGSEEGTVTPTETKQRAVRFDSRAQSPSPFDGAAPLPSPTPERPMPFRTVPVLIPTTQRTYTPETTSSPVNFTTSSAEKPQTVRLAGIGGNSYNHIPQPLLRSMRESFEVLDSNNTGSINSAAVQNMLEQMGLESTPATVHDFFPSNALAQMNLARYLDTLSAPLAGLSPKHELLAAFNAFDVDDSGQIDVAELRRALLSALQDPDDPELRIHERDVDTILREFTGKRAFGTRDMSPSKGKGEVFRYKDFMTSVTGGGMDTSATEATVAA